MAERQYVPHAVSAMLHLAGPQQTDVMMQHPGTEEATITVTVPDCVMYLRTRGAAEGIGQTWRRAAAEALALPKGAGIFQPPYRLNAAEPSVVVHTHGRPPGFVRLHREPGTPTYLHVQIGGLTFFFHDKDSFTSVAGAFLRAAALGAQHLPLVDLRQASSGRHRLSGLAGQAAPEAREHLEQIARHPARIAAASLAQLEDRLVAVVDPLQTALARVRAVREKDGHAAHAHDVREQPQADPDARQDTERRIRHRAPTAHGASEQHAPPVPRRRDHASGPPTSEQYRLGGPTR